MEAPLLFALTRARLRAPFAVQAVWASPRALCLVAAPDRRTGIAPGFGWIFLLTPSPELWWLHEKDAAAVLLKGEAKVDLSRRWGQELKGACLEAVEGDERERWLGLVFRRRAITGRIELMRLAFQAIPGRGGLRLDGLDLNPARMGMGALVAATPPEAEPDSPPLRRWRERFGVQLPEALTGSLPDVLPGEGNLFQRHHTWSVERAEKLILAPKVSAQSRLLKKEEERLTRYSEALQQDRRRHEATLKGKPQAQQVSAELWRLKGSSGEIQLLDGTVITLPEGQKVEMAVQKWFNAIKRAERGLVRLQELERECHRQRLSLAQPQTQGEILPRQKPAVKPATSSKQGKKRMSENPLDTKRADGKGNAFRTVMVDGWEVLIGKGDADNDALTFKVADNADFWLHVAGVPGSHVIIRNPDRISEAPREVIERAAQLAAFYSKARDGGKVEVHHCRVADVSKPRGFAAGKVMLKHYQSVRVYPKG